MRSEVLDFKLPEHLAARQSARRKERGVQIVAGATALVCFAAAAWLIGPVNAIRKERQLVIDPDTVKGLPPDIALLGKLGTFRALAIDWAAIRAERLKEEGKTYEALQLHETICSLAPRFPSVWTNAAWNMAYNISVAQYTPEARWKWVRNGIEILRDRGIQYNPHAVALYKELTYIYWHKIGDFLDDEHLNYKRALAVEMERVLGPPPVTLSDREYFDWFARIVDAPRDLKAWLQDDTEAAALVSRLRSVSLGADRSLLEFVAEYLRPELQTADLRQGGPDRDALTRRRLEILTDPDRREVLDRLLAAVRSDVLRSRYKLDLDWMQGLMVDHYGPLDWRSPFSHALYWATWGEHISEGYANLSLNDRINTARFILIVLQTQVFQGKLTLWPDFDDPFSSYIELTPDTRLIPYLYNAYLDIGKKYFSKHPRFREGTPGPVFMNGFVTNMQKWIELLYLEGGRQNLAMAENFYRWLRDNNPHPNGSTQEQYTKTVAEFVMGDLYDQLQTFKAANAFVRGFVRRGLKQFAIGENRAGVTSLRRAKQAYDIWQIATKRDIRNRRQMAPFADLVRDEMESTLKHPRIAALFKARLWNNLPLGYRRLLYDRLKPYFDRVCDAQRPPWSVSLAFLEPPGMDEFRKSGIDVKRAPRRQGVEEGKEKIP